MTHNPFEPKYVEKVVAAAEALTTVASSMEDAE